MPMQIINLGTYANSGTGDDLRTAFEKVNANFQFLDDTSAVTADNIGLGSRVFKEKVGDNLQLRTIVAGTGMTVTENSSDITLSSIIDITRDTAPQLGGNLVLGGFDITGTGNISTTGTATFSGNLAVNSGTITTTASTVNLINSTASTVNLAGAADFLNLGKNTGLTTVAGELQVNDDVVITNNGRLKTTNTSAYVFNETANYVFVGQSAIRVDLGSSGGIVGLGNDVEVANNLTVSGTIYGNFDATQGTVDLLNVVNTLYANDISLSGNLTGDIVGDVTGNTTGTHTGAVIGNVTGNTVGIHTGAVVGNVTGNTLGSHKGNVVDDGDIVRFNAGTGEFKGNIIDNGNIIRFNATSGLFTGSVIGSLTGDVIGNTTGIHKGNVLDAADVVRFNSSTGVFTGNLVGNVTGNVSGNAGTVTNGVVTTGSYSDPLWITTLSGTKIFGTVPAATTALTVTNGVVTTGSYADPSWITSLSGSKITGMVASAVAAGTASSVTNGVYTTSSINALADVDTVTTPPTNGQSLIWDSASSRWLPGTVIGGGGGSAITVSDEGSLLTSGVTSLNFVGSGVTSTVVGTSVTVTIPGGTGLDFGTFAAPSSFTLDMGTF